MRDLDAARPSDVSVGIHNKGENWNFGGVVSANKVDLSSFRGKLPERRPVYLGDGKAVLQTAAGVDVLVCEGIELKRKNAVLFDQNANMRARLVKAQAVGGKMRLQLVVAQHRITALKTQLANANLAFEKLSGEMSSTKADLRAQGVAAEETFGA